MTIAHIRNISVARNNLNSFVIRKADEIARKIGFGYKDVPNAPACFDELKTAFNASQSSRLALPVWSGASDNTIYLSPGANFAFRFWHDVLHCVLNKGFSTAEEIAIGAMHIAEIQKEYGAHSLEALLMYADTIGQSIYAMHNGGEFPVNQLAWVTEQVDEYIRKLDDKESDDCRIIEMALA